MNIAYPFRIDGRRRTATATDEEHIRHLIEQLLFTAPGERVNRPDFGTGVQQLIFAPNSPELASATEFMIQGALQQWLGELLQVEAVNVLSQESALLITVQYIIRRNRQRAVAEFTRPI